MRVRVWLTRLGVLVMAAPSSGLRAVVFSRDRFRCAACGARDGLEFQHRQAVGMGGSRRSLEACDGLVLCSACNSGVEGPMQMAGLANGWKVRRWVKNAGLVPVWYTWRREWCLLDGEVAVPVTAREADSLMRQTYGGEFLEWVS